MIRWIIRHWPALIETPGEHNVRPIHLLGAVAAAAVLTLASVTMSVTVTAPAVAAATASQDDTVQTSNGPLVIHPVHHAGLVLTWNGKRIVADPTSFPPGPNSGAAAFRGPNPPDLILITHEHGDHFSVPTLTELVGPNTVIVAPQAVFGMMTPALQAKTKVMANGQTQTHAGVSVEAVPEYNITQERLQFHPKGRDNGYVLNLGGQRVYIAGDTEGTPELRALTNIDIAFVPMNLPYTQTVDAAADWVKAFRPKIVYPYHFGESNVEQFRMLVGNSSEVRLRKWY
jgi:L-ascorbate metabolism protein UlaG (beta-lactamase superfamily)